MVLSQLGILEADRSVSVELATLLFQVGAVGAFIFYSLSRNKSEASDRKVLLDATAAERQKRDQDWRDFLLQQSTANLQFLESERLQRREIMEEAHRDFTGGMASVTRALDSIAQAFSQHSADAVTRHQTVTSALDNVSDVLHDLQAPAHTSGSPS